jgi:hypothetical protein
MKPFFILFFSLLALPALPQKWELSPQFQPGLSSTHINNDSYKENAAKAKFAYRYGLTTTYLFAGNIGISTGGFISVSSYDDVYTVWQTDTTLLTNEETFDTQTITLYNLTIPARLVYLLKNQPLRFTAGISYHTYLGSDELTDLFRYPWYNNSWLSAHAGIHYHISLSERIKFTTGFELEAPLTDFRARDDGVRVLNEGNKIWQFYLPVQLIFELND